MGIAPFATAEEFGTYRVLYRSTSGHVVTQFVAAIDERDARQQVRDNAPLPVKVILKVHRVNL